MDRAPRLSVKWGGRYVGRSEAGFLGEWRGLAFMFWQLLLCGCLGPWLRAILRFVSDPSLACQGLSLPPLSRTRPHSHLGLSFHIHRDAPRSAQRHRVPSRVAV